MVVVPSNSGSIILLTFYTKVEQNLGNSSKLLKNRNTDFYTDTWSVVWFATTYIRLHLVSMSKWKAQRSILRTRTSACKNIECAGYIVCSILLRHAYMALPYNRTLQTNEFTNYSFTLTLVIPNNLQFTLIALNVR